jgi:hypothetical protein
MKKTISLFLISVFCLTAWTQSTQYLIMFTNKTKSPCNIIENNPPSNRLKIQRENSVKLEWISYYSISAIVEMESQRDVTDEFIQPSVKKVETKTKIGYDDSVYTYLIVASVVSLIVYLVMINDIKHSY